MEYAMYSKITDKMSDEKLNRVHFIFHVICLFCVAIYTLSMLFLNYIYYKYIFMYVLFPIVMLYISFFLISNIKNYKDKERYTIDFEFKLAIILIFSFIVVTLFTIIECVHILQYQ